MGNRLPLQPMDPPSLLLPRPLPHRARRPLHRHRPQRQSPLIPFAGPRFYPTSNTHWQMFLNCNWRPFEPHPLTLSALNSCPVSSTAWYKGNGKKWKDMWHCNVLHLRLVPCGIASSASNFKRWGLHYGSPNNTALDTRNRKLMRISTLRMWKCLVSHTTMLICLTENRNRGCRPNPLLWG